jgi:hypothetical protein
MGYQPRSNLVKDENDDLLVDSYILNSGRTISLSYWMYMESVMVGR